MPNGIAAAVQAAIQSADLALLSPEIVLALTAMAALLVGAVVPRSRQYLAGWTALFGVFASLVALIAWFYSADRMPQVGFSGLFQQDSFAILFKYLFLISTALVILLSFRFLEEEHESHGEYYALLCFATLGMMFMASGQDLVTIYVGLELMALSIYVLVGFLKKNPRSNEAAMKYFILGAFSSAFFVYGISLFYGLTGSTSLLAVREGLLGQAASPLTALALILLSVGLGFKVAAVPFHAWAPDAYEGAPTPIAAYVSVASKAAAFAILLRILLVGLYDLRDQWSLLLFVLAAASMTLGNFVAIAQDNVKRMLAYSSIAHAGYLLLGVRAAGASVPLGLAQNMTGDAQMEWTLDLQRWAQGGVLLYLFAYTFMNLGAFALVTALRRRDIAGDQVKDFAGLFHRAPFAAIAMAIFLLSLAGIPPTAGFMGKLLLFAGAMKAQHYWLALIAVLNTAVSAFFYFRIMVMMFMEKPREQTPYAWSWELGSVVLVALIATVLVGVAPARFVKFAQDSVLSLGGALPTLSHLR